MNDVDELEARILAGEFDDLSNSNGHHPTPFAGADPELVAKIRSNLLTGQAILDIPPPRPLVNGWLNLDSFAVLYGRPGAGKSFLALDLALSVAAATSWQGCAVTAGPVVYIAAEGVGGIGRRVQAWTALNHQPLPDQFTLHQGAINLLDAHAARALLEVTFHLCPHLVIIDTLHRSMAGGDENSSKDMGLAIAAADRIREETAACVLIVHHSGKDRTAGARGHSSLLGAADTELEVTGTEGRLVLTTTKQKDSIEAPPLHLALHPAGPSAAIVRHDGEAAGLHGLTPTALHALDVLQAIEVPGGIPTGAWLKSVERPERTFYDARTQLLRGGHIVNLGTDHRPHWLPAVSDYLPQSEPQSDPPPTQGELSDCN